MTDFWKGTLAFAFVICMIVWGAMKLDESTCHNRWEGSGYEVRWTGTACLVEVNDKWYPEESVHIWAVKQP